MALSETRYYSTTLSDFVLAVASFVCASRVNGIASLYAVAGFAIIGIAAALGVLRFGVVFPRSHSSVMRGHTFMSWFASIVGIPLIAAAFCLRHYQHDYANYCLLGGGAGFIISIIHPPLQETLSMACSTVAVLGIIMVTYLNTNHYGIAGGVAYALSGVAKGIESLPGLRGVDLFHYALVLGNVFFMYGLVG